MPPRGSDMAPMWPRGGPTMIFRSSIEHTQDGITQWVFTGVGVLGAQGFQVSPKDCTEDPGCPKATG